MSKEFELTDEIRSLKVKADLDLDLLSIGANRLIIPIEELYLKMPFTDLKMVRYPTDSEKFDFKINYVDGREWKQILFIGNFPLRTDLTLLTGIYLLFEEIDSIRLSRTELINFVKQYQVKSLVYKRI